MLLKVLAHSFIQQTRERESLIFKFILKKNIFIFFIKLFVNKKKKKKKKKEPTAIFANQFCFTNSNPELYLILSTFFKFFFGLRLGWELKHLTAHEL